MVDERLPLKQFKQDLEAEGGKGSDPRAYTNRISIPYIFSLKANIDQRFSSALPVLVHLQCLML